ncbi:MAG: hypothetical protein LQ350_005245 [Teloschistes chrysophthalmus]|nr:MAG: hypothetical protein LQ350_005245 [Niorma chrysophthalma]
MNFYDGVLVGWTSSAIAITAAFCLILPAPSTSSYALTLVAVVTVIQPVVWKLCGIIIAYVSYAITPSPTYIQPAPRSDPTLVFRVPYSDDSDSEESLASTDLKGSIRPIPCVEQKGSFTDTTTKDSRYIFSVPHYSCEDSYLSDDLERRIARASPRVARWRLERVTKGTTKDQTGGASFTGHKARGRGFLALPTELGIQIFRYLQNDKESLAHLRRVCSHFKDLASPVLFESVHFRRTKKDWVKLYALCASTHLTPHVKVFKLEIGYLLDGIFPLPPPGLQTLKVKSLQVYDYRCLRMGDVRLPIQTQLLTNLCIDTRGIVIDKGEYLRSREMISTWKPFYNRRDFQNLQSLVITQEPDERIEANWGVDVVFLLQDCDFKNLRDLKLHFITTSPECLVKLLDACISDKLERVRLYKPVWAENDSHDLSVERSTTSLEHNISIEFEGTPQWTRRKYTEEEFTFMVVNDIVPEAMMRYNGIEPGESEVLDRWNEMRTGKNPAKEQRRAQLFASRASVYDPLPDDA